MEHIIKIQYLNVTNFAGYGLICNSNVVKFIFPGICFLVLKENLTIKQLNNMKTVK